VINDDAYLALIVQRGGFRVKRVQDAVVWIVGPRSPADYVNQRSRVIRGHLQLIRLLGKMPSTLEFIVIRQPGQSIGLLVRTVAKHGHRYLMALFTAVLLEFLSFQMALISSFRRKDTKWRMVESTKKF
jgi:cellulose synthase/poly-beta-1,6-N-acetylglucosamine synthase-like glycosyltransferase